GCFGCEQKLVRAYAKSVPIDGRHSGQTPVLGRLCQPSIDFLEMVHHALVKIQAKRPRIPIAKPPFDEPVYRVRSHVGVVVALEEELQCHFSCTGAFRHALSGPSYFPMRPPHSHFAHEIVIAPVDTERRAVVPLIREVSLCHDPWGARTASFGA